MAVALISHPDCALHEMGQLHPESPARLAAISDQLIASGLDASLHHYTAPLVSREQLYRVHAEAYIDGLFDAAPQHGLRYIDPDTSMNPYTLAAAQRAAGAGVRAVELVAGGEVARAFCSVRPPGHHAEHDRSMGFCFFNNIAVAAAHALAAQRFERVAILDFDVHHGNGTEDIFRNDERVLLCSTFQHPFYPGRGGGAELSHIVNVPLAAGDNGAVFRDAVNEHWLPALDAHRPQLIFVSAGFDGHAEDHLAQLRFGEADYSWVTQVLCRVADDCCDGRVVSMLEGGYALSALGRSVVAHIKALL